MKILAFLIDVIYWFGLFISPLLISGFVALCLYSNKTTGLFLSALIGGAGLISGIVFAEYVRKKYGLNNFWSGISTNLHIGKRMLHDKKDKI